MPKLSLKDLSVKGKKVLMRVDFNVPLDERGKITDDTRIREALASIEYVLKQGGSVILMSHLGRPKGKSDPKFTLAPCAEALSKLLGKPVQFAKDCIGDETAKMAKNLKESEVLLLENLRFYAAEEDPSVDPTFAQKLAKLGDIYVNDAFGTAHRAHSSTYAIVKYFPGKAAAGFLMQKELSFLEPLIKIRATFLCDHRRAKISSKIGVLKSLITKVDALFIGGGMAFTFFKAQNISIGKSICEDDLLQTAREIMQMCTSKNISIYFPKDLLITDNLKENGAVKTIFAKDGIPDGWEGADIGPQTVKEWSQELKKAQTIFWNGPVGVFESLPLLKALICRHSYGRAQIYPHYRRGDSVAAINQLNLAKNFTHLSTGGGAALEFLEYGKLPGIEVLTDAENKK